MKKYKLDNGWIVLKKDAQPAILHVLPIPNSLFRKEQIVEIPDVIYRDIESGETSIKELFKKYKLHEFIFQWESRKPSTSPKYQNTKNKFFGIDFLATEENGSYYLMYELSRHGGGHRKIPISKDIYEDARTGKFSTSDLFKKYNLFHLDVPENDVN
jgi:Mor family transcriptional regulator